MSKHCAAEYRIYAAFLARGNVRAAGQSGRFHLEEATIADLHRAISRQANYRDTTVAIILRAYRAYNGVCVKGEVDPGVRN